MNLNGKHHYGDISANKILSKTVVAMGPPTVFEIIDVRESDHRRTSVRRPIIFCAHRAAC